MDKVRAVLLATTILASCSTLEARAATSSVTQGPDTSGIRVVACSPTKRVDVVALIGQPLTFSFPEGASIYRLGFGESFQTSWKAPSPVDLKEHPLGNNMTLWPVKPTVEMVSIITAQDSDGRGQRVNPFRLVSKKAAEPESKSGIASVLGIGTAAAAPASDPEVTYNLICKYAGGSPGAPAVNIQRAVVSDDDQQAERPKKVSKKERRQQEQREASRRILVDAFNAAGGCHYTAQPPESPIKPKCPMDNGVWTMMRFAGLSDKPTVYAGKCDGKEQLVRQHGYRDFVVAETIAPSFCLRLGGAALNILNASFNPAGAPTGTGTISPKQRREVLQAKAK